MYHYNLSVDQDQEIYMLDVYKCMFLNQKKQKPLICSSGLQTWVCTHLRICESFSGSRVGINVIKGIDIQIFNIHVILSLYCAFLESCLAHHLCYLSSPPHDCPSTTLQKKTHSLPVENIFSPRVHTSPRHETAQYISQ